MRSFSDVSKTIRETALVISISLTFIFLLVAALIIPSVLNMGNLLNPMFLIGLVLFGGLGFFALEIVGLLSFLGSGVRYGVAGFIALILVGAIAGGNTVVAFLSGTISGVTLFYLKSLYAVYVIVKIETREAEELLTVTELEPNGKIYHSVIDGIGSNFELVNNIVEELSGAKQLLYYARYDPSSETRLSRLTEETFSFYANHLSPLHKIKSRYVTNVIKQIAFEASQADTLERGLFNYWLRAYLTGVFTSVIVPYGDDFVEKVAVCERSYGSSIEFVEILGGSDFLICMKSLSREESGIMEVYSRWGREELQDRIGKVHPAA